VNGRLSTASGRSEVNLDATGSGASTAIDRNIIVAANRVLNDCYDSMPRGYRLADNLVQGIVPTGNAGNCISASTSTDPMFTNAATADFHPQSAVAVTYGAYSD
jgi:hypothetical protein